MFFAIRENFHKYYITLEGSFYDLTMDCEIAYYLDIDLEEYRNMCMEQGGRKHREVNEIFFYTKKATKKAITVLEPFLIMKELIR